MFKGAYFRSVRKQNKGVLIPTLDDVNPEVGNFVRARLKTQGYNQADSLPVKVYDGFFSGNQNQKFIEYIQELFGRAGS